MMLTIQVLDADGTQFRPLEQRPMLLGSGEGVDLRLQESGVSARHARIEPIGDGFKIVDLDSEAGTVVNGEQVAQWRLQLGDRIELGRAVLVVGQQVARPATPSDVLETPMARRSARERRAAAARNRTKPFVIAGAVVGVAICGLLAWNATGGDGLPTWSAEIERHLEAGRFDDAARVVGLLRADWAGGDSGRDAKVDEFAAEVARFRAEFERAHAELFEGSWTKTRAEQIDALRASERAGRDGVEGKVARLLLSRIDEIRLAAADQKPSELVVSVPVEVPSDVVDDSVPAPVVDPHRVAVDLERFVTEVRSLHAAGDTAEALARVDETLTRVEGEDAVALRDLRIQLRDSVLADLGALLARARERAATFDPTDVRAAIAELESEVSRFDRTDDAAPLRREIERMRASLDVAASGPRTDRARPADIGIDDLLEAVDAAVAKGSFHDAMTIADSIVSRVEADTSDRARRLRERHADLVLLAALERHLVRCATENPMEFVDEATGGVMRVRVVEDELATDDGPFDWSCPTLASLRQVAGRPGAPRTAVLGLAALAYRRGDAETAERILIDLAGGKVDAEITAVVARGRGDRSVDARGYRIEGGRLTSVRELELRQVLARVEQRVAAAVRLDKPERRLEALEKVLADGPEVMDSVVLALHKQWESQVAALADHKFKKQWEKVGESRRELDSRRAAALQLIFDTKRYFAPYKPPAVSGERYAEYLEVQREIDDLVEQVRQAYDGKQKVKVPQTLHRDRERVEWIAATLAQFGEPVDELRERVEWVCALPEANELTVRNFCWTVAERHAQDRADRVDRFNQNKLRGVPRSESDQVAITNSYRRLLGRQPLAFNPKLLSSARGHADEMSDLGYFSHYSPTPGRESPFDRMRLAGYESGIAENLANHDSAKSAHDGWTHSSGHHRNLLSASLTEFAVGNTGRYWVQNFGGGREFESDEEY
ncbi:MAG: FHA domain-containing protein [Planctomycetes bacterium]|nr:FHA domain-containing protein [Planctomycetota bacterium]